MPAPSVPGGPAGADGAPGLPTDIDADLVPAADPRWPELRTVLGRANRRRRLTSALVAFGVAAVAWLVAVVVVATLQLVPLASATIAGLVFLGSYAIAHTALGDRANGASAHRQAEIDERHLATGAWWRSNPAIVGGSALDGRSDSGALLATPHGLLFLPGRPTHDEVAIPWRDVRTIRVLAPRWTWGWSPGFVADTERGQLTVTCSKGPALLDAAPDR